MQSVCMSAFPFLSHSPLFPLIPLPLSLISLLFFLPSSVHSILSICPSSFLCLFSSRLPPLHFPSIFLSSVSDSSSIDFLMQSQSIEISSFVVRITSSPAIVRLHISIMWLWMRRDISNLFPLHCREWRQATSLLLCCSCCCYLSVLTRQFYTSTS